MRISTSKHLAYAFFAEQKLIILCHGQKNPSDQEWAPYLESLRNSHVEDADTRILVLTQGGHPSRHQQALMTATLRGGSALVAVISPSVVSRFVTSILVMTNPGIRCFSPEQRHQAYAHLRLAPASAPQVDAWVAQVNRCLD